MRLIIPTDINKDGLNFLVDRTYCDLGIWADIIWSLNCWMDKDSRDLINRKPHP